MKVKLWNHYVGAVIWNSSTDRAVFEYDKSFLNLGLDISPIHMPIHNPRKFSFANLSNDTFHGLSGLLADSLPDAYGTLLLDKWLAMNNRSVVNSLERLCYQGKRCMGALEFEPAENMFSNKSESIEISSLVDIAKQITKDREGFTVNFNDDALSDSVKQVISVGTSAGGARAKAVIAYNEETKDVRSGQVDAPKGYEHWLLKIDGVTNNELGDPKYYGVIEYIYYLIACDAGIEMMESQLLRENNRAHFMTKRFDRVGNSEKLHIQTLCGLAHYDYMLLRAYSYEQLFQVMRDLKLPYSDAEQMFRRMVFNVVLRNQDDHTKNVSFIMNRKGRWSLSPAYDITWAYSPKGEWTSKHQMSINDKWEDFNRYDFVSFAKKMNIKNPLEIIEQVTHSASQWNRLAQENELPMDLAQRLYSQFVMDI
ncbi:MAG: type II toxin-antitoxin system HipA family toxin [Rikenellaceae bacterium]